MASQAPPTFDTNEFWKEQDYEQSARACALEIAKQLQPPQAGLLGLDITSSNIPNAAWLPDHVGFQVWDAYGELSYDLKGTFDIVHLRALYSTVSGNNVDPLLSNCLKMLKPSGYL